MGCCCGLDSRIGVKTIAVISAITSLLVVVASIVRLTSDEPETLNDSLGISAAVVFILVSAILYSGAAQKSTGKCEVGLAAGLILCGFQIRSICNTIDNWEHTGPLILTIDLVSVVLAVWFILVVYSFTQKVRNCSVIV